MIRFYQLGDYDNTILRKILENQAAIIAGTETLATTGGGGGSGSVETVNGQSPDGDGNVLVQPISTLGGGSPYAITLGPAPWPKYFITIASDVEFTVSGSPNPGDGAIIESVVTGAPRTVTYPDAYRNNAAATNTSVAVNSPRSTFTLRWNGTAYLWTDEEYSAEDTAIVDTASNFTGTDVEAALAELAKVRNWDGTFDGQGSVIESGVVTYRTVRHTGNITTATVIGDASGAITLTVKKYTPSAGALGAATTLGTVALSSEAHNVDTGLAWAVTAGDVISVETGGTITTVERVNWCLTM